MTRAGVRAVESKRVLVENPSYLLRPRGDAGLAIADVAHRETTATAKRAAQVIEKWCPRGSTPAGHDAFRKQLQTLPAVELTAAVRAPRRHMVHCASFELRGRVERG